MMHLGHHAGALLLIGHHNSALLQIWHHNSARRGPLHQAPTTSMGGPVPHAAHTRASQILALAGGGAR